MKSEQDLKEVLADLAESKIEKNSAEPVNAESVDKESSLDLQNTISAGSFEKKRKSKFLKTMVKEKLSVKGDTLIKKEQEKNIKPKTVTQVRDESLELIQARKFQMMTNANNKEAVSSPLQMHLIQSESLKIAQEKISDLEEEISSLRKKNESLVSAGEILNKKNETLKTKLDDLKSSLNEEKNSFKDEKDLLLSALEKAREQLDQLARKKQELEKRLSSNFHGIRQRESTLEGRIEILKMENSVVQKEKDKKILELKKDIQKINYNLESSRKQNHEISSLNNKLKESFSRTVSALRATIYNLEGAKMIEETVAVQTDDLEKAS